MGKTNNTADDIIGFAVSYFGTGNMRNKQQKNKPRKNEFADVAQEKQNIDVMMNLIFIDHTAFPKILRMTGGLNKRENISIAVVKIVLLV